MLYIKPDGFEAKFTQRIVLQLEAINKKLVRNNTPYMLIGFGRWGSSDPWLGVPVKSIFVKASMMGCGKVRESANWSEGWMKHKKSGCSPDRSPNRVLSNPNIMSSASSESPFK